MASPAIGTASYLAYVGIRFGEPLAPYRIQNEPRLHGPNTDPVHKLIDLGRAAADGQIGSGLHLPWLLTLTVLLIVMIRRFPASYTVWSALTLFAGIYGNVHSVQRYTFVFPFVIALAVVAKGHRRFWTALVAVTASVLAVYSTLAFLGLLVP